MNARTTSPNRTGIQPSPASATSSAGLSIGAYLIKRLQDYGIDDVFGIPGDYVLSFYSMLESSPLNVYGCTREDCAGFAADGYARLRGMGAVCVTYCVGGLSRCNSIAGAFAEKSPVVMLTGSPGMSERLNSPLLHHMVRDFHTQIEVFEKLCIAVTELSDPTVAFREIDRVLDACARYKRPVYIDIPRDMVHVIPDAIYPYHLPHANSEPQVVEEAVSEAARLLSAAERPVILAGVELHRFGLQDALIELAEQTNIPVASTLLGKSVIRETHPLCLGIYEGALGKQEVTEFVEESDLILLLGTFMTDLNLGVFTANLDPNKCIYANSEQLRIRYHHYHNVPLDEFLIQLRKQPLTRSTRAVPDWADKQVAPFNVVAEAQISIMRLIDYLNTKLDDETIVIADIGDSLFAATELISRGRTEFLSAAYYTSMGFSVPASVGAHVACPEKRVVVICGDGAFQMTGMELSTSIRNGFAPIVIVLDNQGYGTERFLHEGVWKYNDIHGWEYSQLTSVLRGGRGYDIRTESQFIEAIEQAWNDRSVLSLLHVRLSSSDSSETLQRLGERLKLRV
ncbi:MAG: alpha-keto acid decarboxylase family protein [Caldilineaceae bacterium]|nr:alpha-keto acid decarboxylase family protein [Caldilineaceae bacterium]